MVASSDDIIKHLAVVILIDTSCVREYTVQMVDLESLTGYNL